MRAYKKGHLWITFGLLFIATAVLLTGYNSIIQFNADKASKNVFQKLVPLKKIYAEDSSAYIKNQNIEMSVKTVDERDYIGMIEIASLKIELPVMAEWDYSGLRISPCRYTGSVYQNNLIICAHNYKSHFGKINTLEVGDSVTFTDINGNVFRFKVHDIETVKPNATEITSGNWDLTLFTCTTAGTSRVTVRCVREKEQGDF